MPPHDRKLYLLLLRGPQNTLQAFTIPVAAHRDWLIKLAKFRPSELSRSVLTDPAPFAPSAQCCLRSYTCISFFSPRYRSLTRTRGHVLRGWHSRRSSCFIRLFLWKNTAFPHGPVCINRPSSLRSELGLYLRGRFVDSEAVWRIWGYFMFLVKYENK